MKICGVDCGIHGGIAVVKIIDGAAPQLVAAIDIPVAGCGAKERVDVLALCDWIRSHKPDHALIERAGSMPKQGIASTFKYGRAVGAIEAAIACCGVPVTIIEPSRWKRAHGLHQADKEASRLRALQLFPQQHGLFARKRDHQRAEASLIALAEYAKNSVRTDKAPGRVSRQTEQTEQIE